MDYNVILILLIVGFIMLGSENFVNLLIFGIVCYLLYTYSKDVDFKPILAMAKENIDLIALAAYVLFLFSILNSVQRYYYDENQKYVHYW